MPMPLSRDGKRQNVFRAVEIRISADQPSVAGATLRFTEPRSVNLNAFESRFFRT